MNLLRYSGISLFGILLGIWVFCHSNLPPGGAPPPADPAGRMVRAGLEDLFPLIIGAIWVIAQIAGAAAQKKKKSAPSFGEESHNRPRADDRNFEQPPQKEDPFGHLLRQLSGDEEFHMPQQRVTERPPEPPRPHPAAQHPSGMKKQQIDALPDMARRRIPEADVLPIEQKASIAETVREIEKTQTRIRPKMSAFRNSIPSIKLPSMPAAGLRIDNPSYAEASRGTQGIGDELHLKDRNALRRAMLSHIIFSPPKALERNGG